MLLSFWHVRHRTRLTVGPSVSLLSLVLLPNGAEFLLSVHNVLGNVSVARYPADLRMAGELIL